MDISCRNTVIQSRAAGRTYTTDEHRICGILVMRSSKVISVVLFYFVSFQLCVLWHGQSVVPSFSTSGSGRFICGGFSPSFGVVFFRVAGQIFTVERALESSTLTWDRKGGRHSRDESIFMPIKRIIPSGSLFQVMLHVTF